MALHSSPRENAEQALKYRETCKHERMEIRRRKCADGRIQFVRECQKCYKQSNPIKAAEARGDEPLVTELDRDYFNIVQWDAVQEKFINFESVREARRQERENYYKSPRWKEKRDAVMARDKHECQECYGRATDVHHITYLHFQHERLYELVALCRKCHETISAESGHGAN